MNEKPDGGSVLFENTFTNSLFYLSLFFSRIVLENCEWEEFSGFLIRE